MNDDSNIFSFQLLPLGSVWIVNFVLGLSTQAEGYELIQGMNLFICRGQLNDGPIVNGKNVDKQNLLSNVDTPFYQYYELDYSDAPSCSGCTVVVPGKYKSSLNPGYYTLGYRVFHPLGNAFKMYIYEIYLTAIRIA